MHAKMMDGRDTTRATIAQLKKVIKLRPSRKSLGAAVFANVPAGRN
jgi:hypothetical protein